MISYEWKRLDATSKNVESILNGVGDEWEVFQLLPKIEFTNTKIAFGVSVPLPGEVLYDIILRRPK